jgi:hypothetical protein
VALSLRGRPLSLTLPRARDRWRVLADAGEARFGGPSGARVDGERVTLPAWGTLVLTGG